MSIIVDKEFESLIPPLTDDEFQGLEESILKNGCYDPLKVWKRSYYPNEDAGYSITDDPDPYVKEEIVLIDGHNRYKICQKHNIPFKTIEFEFDDRDAVIEWIADNQLDRRNLNMLDREALISTRREAMARQARKRQATSTGGTNPQLRENLPQAVTGRVRDIIGKELGVSGRQVDKLHAINEKATPQTKQLVREGKLSINQAYNSVHPKRPDPVKQAKQEHKEYAEKKADSVIDFKAAQIDQINQQIINNDLYQSVVKLLGSIEDFGILYKREELDKALEGIGKEEQERLINKCDTSISIIRIIIESLGGIRWRK